MTELDAATLLSIRCASDIIRGCRNGVVLTGAGISTASGIPDFRSTDNGIWQKFDPFEVASLSAFRYNPQKFYGWIRPLASRMHGAQPNPAHMALAQLEGAGIVKTTITQNIDGLHQRAGTKNVVEVHGTLETLTCVSCYRKVRSAEYSDSYYEYGEVPVCPDCKNVLKPDIVLFGEQLPVRPWLVAQEASKRCDLMIVAGSSLEVLPVAGLPMRALENGAHLILINNSETYIDVRADVVFHQDVVNILPRLAQEVLGK
jgi:NAD-dependent deacetylase